MRIFGTSEPRDALPYFASHLSEHAEQSPHEHPSYVEYKSITLTIVAVQHAGKSDLGTINWPECLNLSYACFLFFF
jgi:hypothetical protein